MIEKDRRTKLWESVAAATRYCIAVENAREMDKNAFVAEMTGSLPRLYLCFSEMEAEDDNEVFFSTSYVDEDYYESIRRNLETLFGADDTYLETFEVDMKYSSEPIAASVAEGLADIFQDLYNFATAVKESEGEALERAYAECRENFNAYWSRTLCNVMRPLNRMRTSPSEED